MELAIVFGPLGLGLTVVAACAVRANVPLWSPVGPPNWDFTKSWASNITILGAVFGVFFSQKIAAPPRFVLDPGYPMLSVLFAVLVVMAPLIFRAISKEKAVLTPQSTWDIQYQGVAGGFLIAMLLTLWAALGQLGTLGLLAAEVLAAGKLRAALPLSLLIILAIGLVATVWYAWCTAGPLLKHQTDTGAHADKLVTQMQEIGATPPLDFGPTDAPLPEWRLL